jgi:hydrogenase maturation protease
VLTLVGGVGELFQGDLDLGRRAAERLAALDLGPDVVVEDLHYGAIAVAQRLEELRPGALILVGAAARGRMPGAVERRWVAPFVPDPGEFRRSVEEAGTGHVSIDLVIEVAAGFEALPRRAVVIEVEPARADPSEELSAEAEGGLEEAVALVRLEAGRVPLFELADRVGQLAGDGHLEPSPALQAMTELLRELELLEREGRWGASFALRDRLRLLIAEGSTSEGMDHLDWSQWWGLIEELDRLQAVEANAVL